MGAHPVGSEVQRVRENGLLPSLESNVCISKTRVFELKRRIDCHSLSSVAVLVSVVEKLPVANVVDLGVGELAMADGSGGERK